MYEINLIQVPTPQNVKTIFNPKYHAVTMNMFSKSQPITGMSVCRVFNQKFRYGVSGRGRWWTLNIFMIVDIHDPRLTRSLLFGSKIADHKTAY